MTPTQKQALQYLNTACVDFANTMAPSVRGPFARECQEAIRILEAEPSAPVVNADAQAQE